MNAVPVAGATSASPSPSSRQSSTADGTRARKASGPASTGTPASASVRIFPPSRSSASISVTATPACCKKYAVASPVMPPPTTATRLRSGMAPDVDPADDFGHAGAEGGIGVGGRGAGERQPEAGRLGPGLHVQVVEDLQVIGDETARADHHTRGTGTDEHRQHGEQVGADPRLRCPAGAL